MADLATLEIVPPKEAWSNEAQHFTPWLAENINILFKEIGISGGNVKTEQYTGRFYVDIIAEESDTGKKIIIENQLNRTDHDHLGKLLTYASSFDASIIIWIVSETTYEHQRAIEWFNDHMDNEIAFFLVRIEVYRIGDSKPAPKFNVIVEPNYWSKAIKLSTSDASITQMVYFEFWDELKKHHTSLRDTKTLILTNRPRPQSWFDISIGSKDAIIRLDLSVQKKQMSAGIYIHKNDDLYQFLHEQKDTFEEFVKDEIHWHPSEGKQASRIRCIKDKWDPDNEAHKQGYYKWMIDRIQQMYEAFITTTKEYESNIETTNPSDN
ncbi:MAG: DUF4268 domain-containing protein [Bacteroidetes bacterium]|nr:DUF4268 domain-containing protein [Bacteroidota bacterium]